MDSDLTDIKHILSFWGRMSQVDFVNSEDRVVDPTGRQRHLGAPLTLLTRSSLRMCQTKYCRRQIANDWWVWFFSTRGSIWASGSGRALAGAAGCLPCMSRFGLLNSLYWAGRAEGLAWACACWADFDFVPSGIVICQGKRHALLDVLWRSGKQQWQCALQNWTFGEVFCNLVLLVFRLQDDMLCAAVSSLDIYHSVFGRSFWLEEWFRDKKDSLR